MKVSVILSTYNSPKWLEKVLWGYAQQTHREFEVVIADDGSKPDTKDLIDRMRGETHLDITHVWQKDAGFRKCRILNKAILQATADYLLISDGDCIPRRDFVEVHVRNAAPGYFLSGTYYKLPMSTSELIDKVDILSGQCFDLNWLLAHGLPRKPYRNLRLTATDTQARILHRLTTTRCNFKGSNASLWRNDALAINGFDERMEWGGLDREFGVRLVNNGIRPRRVWYTAVCIHLDHARGYKNPAIVEANRSLRKTVAREKLIRTEHGITQLLDGGYDVGQMEMPVAVEGIA
ncbi:MAG: glycosyltransferase family 2 protein [Thiotrichales bacterium]